MMLAALVLPLLAASTGVDALAASAFSRGLASSTGSNRPEIQSPMDFMCMMNLASTVPITHIDSMAATLNEQNELLVERYEHIQHLLYVLSALLPLPTEIDESSLFDMNLFDDNAATPVSTSHVYASHILNGGEFLCLKNQLESSENDLPQLKAFQSTLEEQRAFIQARLTVIEKLELVAPTDEDDNDVTDLLSSIQSILTTEEQGQLMVELSSDDSSMVL